MFQNQTTRMFLKLGCLAVALSVVSQADAEPQVKDSLYTKLGEKPLHLYIGTVALPADGLWRVHAPNLLDNVRELYLTPTQPSRIRQLGKRMYAALEERQIQNSQWHVQMGFESCRQFAEEHNGMGPRNFAELGADKRWKYYGTNWENSHPFRNELSQLAGGKLEGPYVFLIPQAVFQFSEPKKQATPQRTTRRIRRTVARENRTILAFELRPFIDDGKHWVLFTDGRCERIDVDQKLVTKYKAKIRPILNRDKELDAAKQPTMDYRLVIVAESRIDGQMAVESYNQVLDQKKTLRWPMSEPKERPKKELIESLTAARKFAWEPYLFSGGGGVLSAWNQSNQIGNRRQNNRRSLSMFSVLGGRAAIEETLQLQDLVVLKSEEPASIAVDSLKGVEVKSHPFESMLKGQPGGMLELANYVPHDRFFVYVGKPEKLPALLDTGAPFIANLGTSVTGNCLTYDIESRYLSKLGMTRAWVDAVLESGMTSEMAMFAPDLFFIDGTEITVIAKLKKPALLKNLLSLIGVSDISKSITELRNKDGNASYLALRNDLLFASTNLRELELSLALFKQQGQNSLGTSAEFRYMLTKLGISDDTRIYAYLSDPFVRRLVGPRVKIGQRRRMLSKAKMEALTARSMLARLDGKVVANSAKTLVRDEYLPEQWHSEDLSIEANGLVRSERFGPLPDLKPLRRVPLNDVTPEEAEAYRRYVENYSRYWRRFFDPIAVRLDDVGDQLELATFILPLVDNSIYNGLRSMLAHQSDKSRLAVPIVEPTPVLKFSANLNDQAWQMAAGNFSDFFTRYSGASSAILDDFGPSVHVAIFDADPIIAMGSGDIFGAFGGDFLRGRGNDMMMIPVALSLLTRPCSIFIETKSPERTSKYLRQAALAGSSRQQRRGQFGVSFYQVGDRNEWVWTMDVFGVVKLRYGVEVVGKYLVIRNVPWSSDDRVVSVEPAQLNAAVLQVNPAACKLQLPGLFAAAADGNRKASLAGLGRLYPFMLAGSPTIEHAAAEHKRIFGFYPRQLPGDSWSWADYRMVSRDYGEPTRQRQPAFDPKKPFGLMNRVDFLKLNMQFEDDGLRSSVRWRLK